MPAAKTGNLMRGVARKNFVSKSPRARDTQGAERTPARPVFMWAASKVRYGRGPAIDAEGVAASYRKALHAAFEHLGEEQPFDFVTFGVNRFSVHYKYTLDDLVRLAGGDIHKAILKYAIVFVDIRDIPTALEDPDFAEIYYRNR